MSILLVIPSPRNSRWRPKTGSSFILACVDVFERYLSQLVRFPLQQIECHCQYCHSDQNLSWCHILRWRWKSTTTILHLTSSTCERSKRYVQNWKYFRFVVAILKGEFAVNSNSICLANSVSSTSRKTYDYSLILHRYDVSNTCQTETTSTFLFRQIYFPCDGDTLPMFFSLFFHTFNARPRSKSISGTTERIFTKISGLMSGVSARMLRGCYEETAPVEFPLNGTEGRCRQFLNFWKRRRRVYSC